MLLSDPKKLAASIIEGSNPPVDETKRAEFGEGRPSLEKPSTPPAEGDAMSDTDIGLDHAVGKMMGALKSDDKKAFRSALQSFIDLSGLKGEDEEL